MRAGEAAHLRFVLTTGDDETHLRFGAGIFAMAGEDKNLVAVLIISVVVG